MWTTWTCFDKSLVISIHAFLFLSRCNQQKPKRTSAVRSNQFPRNMRNVPSFRDVPYSWPQRATAVVLRFRHRTLAGIAEFLKLLGRWRSLSQPKPSSKRSLFLAHGPYVAPSTEGEWWQHFFFLFVRARGTILNDACRLLPQYPASTPFRFFIEYLSLFEGVRILLISSRFGNLVPRKEPWFLCFV